MTFLREAHPALYQTHQIKHVKASHVTRESFLQQQSSRVTYVARSLHTDILCCTDGQRLLPGKYPVHAQGFLLNRIALLMMM